MPINNSDAFNAFLRSCKAQGIKPTIGRWEDFIRLLSKWRAA